MQLELFDTTNKRDNPIIELWELFEAYYTCRSNKRNTMNAVAFEVDYESKLVNLWEEINNDTYQPGRSIAFIVNKPVTREIFAADFRDRVVHHLIIKKLNPLFEKEFIFDSYACRIAKGTHLGIRRVNDFIRKCSKNYTADCYILKLDIQGFFMHINNELLFSWLQQFIVEKYHGADKKLLIELCHKVIFNDPTRNSVMKGNKNDWQGLPGNKSLFNSPPGCGLPIGNLSSQVFANFYMNRFDHYIKNKLGIRNYGRYVDDFVIVHPEKEYLKSLIPELSSFLQTALQLTLHPKKNYLQHYSKGVQFLGTIIKPNRIYIANRTKGNFYEAIQKPKFSRKKCQARPLTFIIAAILGAFSVHGQEPKTIKGIAVEKTGTPIPYCSVLIKGTKILTTTNNCGEFELTTGHERFTIVFSCMFTNDIISFERRVNPKEIKNGETVVFQLKKHGKTINKECKKTIDERLKKLRIH